jgi:long-chain acyl-CoA synthetase
VGIETNAGRDDLIERWDTAGRAAARLSKQIELAAAEAELSLPQYRILGLLAEGSSAASALASRLAVGPPRVTPPVDGLVARTLVERRADEQDRRRVAHVLTPAGLGVLGAADRAVNKRLAEIASFFPDGDATGALEGLRRWNEALDGWRSAKLSDR